MNGKIKWFNVQMGYGFVTGEDGKDYFVHRSGIASGREYVGVDKDDTVTFDIGEGKKGPVAANMSLVAAPEKISDPEKTE